ncbi:MAG: NHL repeat-containing protein [Planctomycetota bacterium]
MIRRPGTEYIAEAEAVSDEYVANLFVGRVGAGDTFHTLAKIDEDGNLDTAWGTSGYATMKTLGATYVSNNNCEAITVMSDDSLYFAHREAEWPGDAIYYMKFYNGDEDTPFLVGDTIDNGAGVTATIDEIIYMREISAVAATWGFVIVSSLAGGEYAQDDTITGVIQGSGKLSIGATMLDGNYRGATKLDSDGAVDTSWAINGHLPLDAGTSDIWKIIPDDSGNLYILQTSGTDLQVLSKVDSSGNYVWAKKESTTAANREYFLGYHDGVLSSDETKLYLCGYGSTLTAIGFQSNIMCVNTSDGTVDTSWGKKLDDTAGNGYVECKGSSGEIAYSMTEDSDGYLYVAHKRVDYGGVYYSLIKINSTDGARDTSWGTDGRAGIDRWAISATNQTLRIDDDENLWAIASPDNGYGSRDVSITYLEKYDSSGTRTTIKTISGVGNNAAYSLFEYDDTIYLGGSRVTLDGIDTTLRSYDMEGTYISGWPVANMVAVPNHAASILYLVPAYELSGSLSGQGTAAPAARLIPFEYSTDDAYVLSLTDSSMGFFRTTE